MGRPPTREDPHPLLLFGTRSSHDFAGKVDEYLKSSKGVGHSVLGRADDSPFPNGEAMVRIQEDVRERDVFVIAPTCRMRFPNQSDPYAGVNDNLMTLLIFGDALRRASAYRKTAVIPFFGYARQDRKSASRTPITARLVADLIETAGFDRVLTMDLHADQIQGFFQIPLDHLNAGQIFVDHFCTFDLAQCVILSPDIGNVKKANKYRPGLNGVEIAYVDKQRDPNTGKVTSERIVGAVRGKNVLVFDDIISTAGTMRAAIDLAEKDGAKAFYLAATHGEFVGPAVERLSHPKIKQIVITDTVPMLPEVAQRLPIVVKSVAPLVGEAVRRIHDGESISELLGIYG